MLGGCLALGVTPSDAIAVVRNGDGAPEITPWLVIRPDDTVVMRIALTEMGQGASTGVAPLLAEEREYDGNKIAVPDLQVAEDSFIRVALSRACRRRARRAGRRRRAAT